MMIFNHKAIDWRSGHRFIGLLFILAALISLGRNIFMFLAENEEPSLWIGIAFFTIGIILTSLYSGTLLDLEQKNYRSYTSILGLKRGKWQELPAIDHIYIGSITEESTNMPNGVSPTLTTKTSLYFVILMLSTEEALLSFQFAKSHKAEETADVLSDKLGVPKQYQL